MPQERIWKMTILLSIVWTLSILYGEMFAFWLPSLWACSWPQLHRSASFPNMTSEVIYPGNLVKVAVLADPQLTDRTSHGHVQKSLALEILQFYTDLFMRRAYLASILPLKPDVILFLGDYFDGGHILSDEEWLESLSRFKHIFDWNTQERDSRIQVYYIPGNHDIGYTGFHSYRPQVITRYESQFQKRNYQFKIGEVEFVAIDAQTLDGDPRSNLTSATWDFVNSVTQGAASNPKVLLTHIPLYRPDETYCGSHRHSPVINQRISWAARDHAIIYQNYITEQTTKYLLDLLKPVLILSGHDHDQCIVTHSSSRPVKEHTLGTISWQQGNVYPSFMLMSVSNSFRPNGSNSEDLVSVSLCFLPAQTFIYLWYLLLLVMTVMVLLFRPSNAMHLLHNLVEYSRTLKSCNIFEAGGKEKVDENVAYEMVWDAEGSMHLVKKVQNVPLTRSAETRLVERGPAIMRPSARKHNDVEASFKADTVVDTHLDGEVKLSTKTGKPRKVLVCQRVFTTFQMLTVIAAVNVPLYMVLLFKDWIDQ